MRLEIWDEDAPFSIGNEGRVVPFVIFELLGEGRWLAGWLIDRLLDWAFKIHLWH
jgi:hypothetical protein